MEPPYPGADSLFKEFLENVQDGTILEFGTGSGYSSLLMRELGFKGRIVTFDSFLGLPSSERKVPYWWSPGSLAYPESQVRDALTPFSIEVITQEIENLKYPIEYGLKKINGVNIDVDIYESTVASLIFVGKCEWDTLFVRFDEWADGGYGYGIHEAEAMKDIAEKLDWDFEIKDIVLTAALVEIKR